MKGAPKKYAGPVFAALAFLAAFGFFRFWYPYHLLRREQMNLFLWDWDYIGQTYRGMGWLARFTGDFADQFFHLPSAGPLLVALGLTLIGICAYKIGRKFLGVWPSLAIGTAFYLWSFLRETGNLFCTRYTVVVLGYLALLLLALQFRKAWMKSIAAVLLVGFGVWALGAPVHHHYGKAWGKPSMDYERVIGLDTEVARENWDQVIKLSKKDLYMMEASYCYNLAHAMKGDLGNTLFDHSQEYTECLLIQFTSGLQFPNCLAGEAWFHLGDMTIAEQSAIIALQASPKHTGTRYIQRLAKVNLISGDNGAAQKYLGVLSKTLFYGKWAREMLSLIPDGPLPQWVTDARKNLAKRDFVHSDDYFRPVLQGLLEANPENTLAQNYLLCYDLLWYNLDAFMEDVQGVDISNSRLYQEALLIWLDRNELLSEENLAQFGVSTSQAERMRRFFNNPTLYRNTYWYHYMNEVLK